MKLVGGILLAGTAILTALSACGGSTPGATPVPTVPTATATAKQPDTPFPTPTARALLPATPVPTNDLLARGKLVYEKTAGGVGCASCHGLDGKGKPEIGARPNRGASETQVRGALIGGVPVMSFIKLSEEEITAVVAYLKYLDEQP